MNLLVVIALQIFYKISLIILTSKAEFLYKILIFYITIAVVWLNFYLGKLDLV